LLKYGIFVPQKEIVLSTAPTQPLLLDLYRMMVRIRAFEAAAEEASQGGVSAYGKSSDGKANVKGPLHLSTGRKPFLPGFVRTCTPPTSSPPRTVGMATPWPKVPI